jgi:peptidoglycan/LPS O-acetylase OafA/YrhL
LKYRAEIDGLRALAVVPVILFHAGFELFGGGFVGVDVFFVISGYLITTILVEDIENNRFSIVNFYERRARRILPALFFVMLVCIPFAWMWMLPSQMTDFSQSLIAMSLFASNIQFWQESGYFRAAAEEMPLLHTWSLAVEEQYYLLFPIFLFLAWRFGKNRVFWMIVVFAVISLMLSEWGWRNHAPANFYLAPTRAWELFAGSITAFVVQKRGVRANNVLSLIGLAAIVFAIFAYDETTPFPSVYALVPVVGVVLLVLYASKETLVAKFLSTKAFVGIGLISYSAYLWHQPLFAFTRIRLIEEPSLALMGLLSVASLVLSVFSWRYIENVFRDKALVGRKQMIGLSLSAFIGFVAFGAAGVLNNGFERRLSADLTAHLDQANKRFDEDDCQPIDNLPAHPYPQCTNYFIDDSASVMLLGDSHLGSIDKLIQQRLYGLGISSYSVAYGGCVPIQGLYRVDEDSSHRCDEYNQSMIEYARATGIHTIILVARFPLYLNGNRYNNGEGGVESGKPAFVDTIGEPRSGSYWDDEARIERVSRQYFDELTSLSEEFNVIVFEPTPEVGWNVPIHFTKLTLWGDNSQITHSFEAFRQRIQRFDDILNRIPNPNLYRFSVADTLCNENTNRCVAADDRGIFYRDSDHLSILGASLVVDDFVANLPKPLRTQ